MRLLPGDPILMYVTRDDFSEITSQEEIAELRHKFGLDRPMYIQYADWVISAVRGDLGESIFLNTPVAEEMARTIPKTLFLGVIAWVLSNIFGMTFGILSAVRRSGWIDNVVTSIANIGVTAPNFWIGIMLISLFGVTLGWLPVMGYTPFFEDPLLAISQLIMPVFCLAIQPLSGITRQSRSAMLEVIRQDYIRTAWAKGLSEVKVIGKHAMRNGIIPIVTMGGMQLRGIIGGSVFVENVFNIPGMGRLAVEGIQNQDYAVVQGVVLLIAVITTMINLLVDITYGYIDPRIRYS